MTSRSFFGALMLLVFAAAPLASAQTPAPAISTPPAEQPAATPAQPTPSMQGMDRMSDSVTKMSEMCMMMMKKEMASAPYKMAAVIGLGVLLLIALVLFVILETQWIIYWSRLLKTQKRNDLAAPR